jgi:hypothetical protein
MRAIVPPQGKSHRTINQGPEPGSGRSRLGQTIDRKRVVGPGLTALCIGILTFGDANALVEGVRSCNSIQHWIP